MRFLKKILIGFFALIGMMVMLSIGGILLVSLFIDFDSLPFHQDAGIDFEEPAHIILHLDLNQEFHETYDLNPFETNAPARLKDVVVALQKARQDTRIFALVLDIDHGFAMDLAKAQEIRQALLEFKRESGKPVYLYATGMGHFHAGDIAYYLASVADDIWLAPSGAVALTGLSIEIPYAKAALDKLDITADIEQRHEFKGGLDLLVYDQMPVPFATSMTRLLGDLSRQIQENLAENTRQLPANIWGKGPYLAHEARANNLVERIGYRDEFTQMLRDRFDDLAVEASENGRASSWDDVQQGSLLAYGAFYAAQMAMETDITEQIALIYGDGIIDGRRDFGNQQSFRSYDVAAALESARKDNDIRGVILRINSPGGDYALSDMVWREVMLLKAAKKPVVVSMGNMAASGGYFIAMAADRIVAQPATITGSIGVYSGKIAMMGLWDKLGVSWGRIETGDNAGMASLVWPMRPQQRQKLKQHVDFIYEDFLTKLAMGRGLDKATLDKVARGRLWTGAEALEIGLVDRLGGLDTAFKEMADLLEVSVNRLRYTTLPEARGFLEWLQVIQADGIPLKTLPALLGAAVTGRQNSGWLDTLHWLVATTHHQLMVPPFRVAG